MAPYKPPEDWSDDLIERTRRVVIDFWPNLDAMGRICLKNSKGRFGTMDGYDLHRGILRVADREDVLWTRFINVESLLKAGWVLD